jgi:hypothetical protein
MTHRSERQHGMLVAIFPPRDVHIPKDLDKLNTAMDIVTSSSSTKS